MSGVCGIYLLVNSLFLETMRGVAARVSLHHIVMICCDEYCRCCIGASGFVRMVRK